MKTYELRRVVSEGDWRSYHEIRRTALFESRGRHGVYDEDHPDEYNRRHYPLLMFHEGVPIATVRLDDFGAGAGALRLVAVRVDRQRQGHGRCLARLAEDFARKMQIRTLYVNAGADAVGYYQKMGWTRFIWDISELEGIAADCVQMKKDLSQ
jgi:N-acetylglutamate synthase-like GNAT family acetyltransferase